MPVLCFFAVLVAFLAIFTDGTVLLLKKISTGRFDAHFSEMDRDMRECAFLPCLILGGTVFPALFTTTFIISLGHYISVLIAIFALSSHVIYRTLLFLSDRAARKYHPTDNDISRQKAHTGRRWAFLILGLFAFFISAIIMLIFRGLLKNLA